MKTVVIKETDKGAEVYIDDAKIDGITDISIEKIPGRPITLKLSGAVLNEVQVGP